MRASKMRSGPSPLTIADRLAVACMVCGAQPEEPCRRLDVQRSVMVTPHATRKPPAGSVDYPRSLKVRRLEAGLTPRELGLAAGVERSTISHAERVGRAAARTRQRVERALRKVEEEQRRNV